MKKKLISIVTPCFNEEGNVDELYERIKAVMSGLNYQYEHIFIDNASTEGISKKLRALAAQDKCVKVFSTRVILIMSDHHTMAYCRDQEMQ